MVYNEPLNGTGVWMDNAKELIESWAAAIDDCIGTRDDILQYLSAHDFDKDTAFRIMESVRKGHGLSKVWENGLLERNVSEWYIESCKKIRYLFPRVHAASYTKMALMIAWYKVYYPAEFYTAWLQRSQMNNGGAELPDQNRVEERIEEYEETDHLTIAMESEMSEFYVLREMYARGIQPAMTSSIG